MRRSVDYWYLRISRGFFTPPTTGAFFLAAFVASFMRGTFPPVEFWAVCLHRAMVMMGDDGVWNCVCCWQGLMGGREVFVLTPMCDSILVPTLTVRRWSKIQCAKLFLPSALIFNSHFLLAEFH